MGKSNGCLLGVVVGIVAIIAYGYSLGPINPGGHKPKTKESVTMGELTSLRIAAYRYWQANGKLPSTTDNASFTKDILKGNEAFVNWQWWLNARNELVDTWGTPLRISSPAERTIFIDSAGPDKAWGTADDIQDHTQFSEN
jgi:hypothetical protein